jgi:hypothetical protein
MEHNMTSRMISRICTATASCLMLSVIGCTYDTTQQNTADHQNFEQRKQAVQSDPMNYKIPDDADTGDLSGGSINNYDKNAMKRDMNDVLNP